MYGIKRQFGLFLQRFLPKYDKTAGLVGLLLLMIGILPDIIWVYYSEDHKSESWDQLAYTNPAGASHHRFVKLPVSLFCQCCWPVTFPGVYVLLASVCVCFLLRVTLLTVICDVLDAHVISLLCTATVLACAQR